MQGVFLDFAFGLSVEAHSFDILSTVCEILFRVYYIVTRLVAVVHSSQKISFVFKLAYTFYQRKAFCLYHDLMLGAHGNGVWYTGLRSDRFCLFI